MEITKMLCELTRKELTEIWVILIAFSGELIDFLKDIPREERKNHWQNSRLNGVHYLIRKISHIMSIKDGYEKDHKYTEVMNLNEEVYLLVDQLKDEEKLNTKKTGEKIRHYVQQELFDNI